MKNNYLKHIIIFFVVIVGIDIAVGYIGKQYFKDITFGFYGNINNSIKATSDILILGSSRALHHYNAESISQETGMSCYNAGTGGYGLFLDYAVLSEKIHQKNIPKMVILDVSPNTLIVGPDSYSKLDRLLPYYNEYDAFKEIIILNPEYSKLQQVFNLYKYNSTLYDFINSYIEKEEVTNGYIPIVGTLNINNFNPFFLESTQFFDENKMEYLKKIISLCKANDIMLLGVVSPTYLKFDTDNRLIRKLDSIFNDSKVQFYDYSDFKTVYNQASFFKDQIHMNHTGTDKFSTEMIAILKRKLKTE